MTRWRTILAIDSDPRAVEVYRANFPGVPVLCCRVEDSELLPADVILAGFPCQPHSVAGERKAGADERDGGDALVAAIERVRPRMFLGENVPGILSSENGRYVRRLVGSMEKAGYVVEVRTLDAVDYGVPQFRARVFFWGIRDDVEAAHRWPVRTHMDPSKRGALFGEDLPPWVSCGGALGLAVYDMQNGAELGDSRPCGTIQGEAQSKGGWAGHYAIHRPRGFARAEDRERPDHPVSEQCPTVDNHHSQASQLNLAIRRARGESVKRPDHPCSEPCPTIGDGSGGTGGVLRVVGQTSHAGGAEGLVRVETKQQRSARNASGPGPTLGVDQRATLGVDLPQFTIFGEPVKWIRKGDDWMRRLSPLECARLQSVLDEFVWPAGVSKSARYRIIGNGVACGIAAHLSRALAEADPESRTVLDLFCGGGLWASGWHGRAWRYQPKVS